MQFSQAQAQAVGVAIQAALRDTNHPDLPAGQIKFALLIQGQGDDGPVVHTIESHQLCDIQPAVQVQANG